MFLDNTNSSYQADPSSLEQDALLPATGPPPPTVEIPALYYQAAQEFDRLLYDRRPAVARHLARHALGYVAPPVRATDQVLGGTNEYAEAAARQGRVQTSQTGSIRFSPPTGEIKATILPTDVAE